MFWDTLAQQILSFAGTFNIALVVALFILLTLGEFGLSIPYVLETVWILSGFHLMTGEIAFYQLILLWMTVAGGRMCGAFIFYRLVHLGSPWIMKIYRKIFGQFIAAAEEKAQGSSLPARLWRRINLFSPYSVAFGRLFWLRIPLTITLGVRGQLKVLELAVLLASLIWDCTYIIVGIVGGNSHVHPLWLVAYSVSALIIINLVTWGVRKLIEKKLSRKEAG